jgi:drug/metabolite transporter (DMT)-like permease
MNKHLLLLTYSIGIIISFVAREYVLDKLYSAKYGPEKEEFKLSIFIVLLQSVINCVYSVVVFMFCRKYCEGEIEIVTVSDKEVQEESDEDLQVPKKQNIYKTIFDFSIPAIAQVFAGFLGNKSMEYVDNTTKTLAKSTKPIAILILGVLCQGKRYHVMRYLGIFMVTVGVTSFLFKSSGKEEASDNLVFGVLLSVGSLIMDGIVGTSQDWLEEVYKPSAFVLMFSTNIWATLVSIISLFLFNEYEMTVNFLYKYPEIWWDLFLFTITCPIGNQFIFLIIQKFGSLQCSIVTTIRKLITILFNSIQLRRNLSVVQWVSVLVVFTGLGLDLYYKDKKPPSSQTPTPTPTPDIRPTPTPTQPKSPKPKTKKKVD